MKEYQPPWILDTHCAIMQELRQHKLTFYIEKKIDDFLSGDIDFNSDLLLCRANSETNNLEQLLKNLIEAIENDETSMKKYLKCQGDDISDADENFLKKYVLSVNQMIDCIEKNYYKCIDDTTNHKIQALKIFKSHVEKVSKSKKLIKQKLRQFDDDDQSNHSAHNHSVNSTYSSNSTNHSNTLNNSVELNSIQDNINNPMDISVETDKILGFSPDDLIQSLENATNQTQQKLTQIVGTDKSTKAKKMLSHLIKTLTASKEIFEETQHKLVHEIKEKRDTQHIFL